MMRTTSRYAIIAALPGRRREVFLLRRVHGLSHREIARRMRRLEGYCLVVTALLVVVALGAFRQNAQKARFTEIDVERINVVEPDGHYRMVISNRPRSIGPIYKGKPFGYEGGGRPGMIFFNDEGTENGGLTFTGKQGPDGKYQASTHMSFDQFNQDQVVNLDYSDNNGKRLMGFSINDRANLDIFKMVEMRDSIMKIPEGPARDAAMQTLRRPNGVPLSVQRVFIGRDPSKNATLNLSDSEGKVRARLAVDSAGNAALEFLDASGKVTSRYPR